MERMSEHTGLISSYQDLITAACTNTGGKMKGSHSRAADRCPFVPRHSLSQVTSFMQLGMLWRGFILSALNKRLSKQSRRWWFETPSRSLWRHWNEMCESELARTRVYNNNHSRNIRYATCSIGVTQRKCARGSKINTITVDVLAPCVTKSSAAMLWTGPDQIILVREQWL